MPDTDLLNIPDAVKTSVMDLKKTISGQSTNNRARATKERQKVMLELRMRGYSYQKIGDALGVSQVYAGKMVRKALESIIREPSELLIEMELARLDGMLAAPYNRAVEYGDKDDIRSCLGIMERRDKLLGLAKTKDMNIAAVGGVLLVPGNISEEEWEATSKIVHERQQEALSAPV